MNTVLLVSNVLSWVVLLCIVFFLMGALRSLAILGWRLEQLNLTTPKRTGRDGLKRGSNARDFTLPSPDGQEFSLKQFLSRNVLLVFTQPSCGPCHGIVPELNRLHKDGDLRVVMVMRGSVEACRKFVSDTCAQFPALIQHGLEVSREYQVFATPFAFQINTKGIIISKGLVTDRQQLSFVLSGVPDSTLSVDSENAGKPSDTARPTITSPQDALLHTSH